MEKKKETITESAGRQQKKKIGEIIKIIFVYDYVDNDDYYC